MTSNYSIMKKRLERTLSGVQEGTCDTFQDAVADLENERERDIRNARINWESRRREIRIEIASRIAQLDKDVEAEKNALHTALLSAITEERVRLQKTGSCLPLDEILDFASKRLQEKQRTNLKRNLKRSHMLAEKRPATRGSHAHENGRRRIAGIPDEPTHLMTAREEKEVHEEYLMLKVMDFTLLLCLLACVCVCASSVCLCMEIHDSFDWLTNLNFLKRLCTRDRL
ncbi:hypothetical protein BCR43DRAFT_296093 [Syncephalastrum racemosum]|uniref:Uncharacterized protein n=1 Tax=Syncephalastrum racemosum TaxID=13706 RepID=A0A1X2H990_SYNRA|nr:hypothetical protein BCR43DRAFT_296093 [Syncephalastrum racemosum]